MACKSASSSSSLSTIACDSLDTLQVTDSSKTKRYKQNNNCVRRAQGKRKKSKIESNGIKSNEKSYASDYSEYEDDDDDDERHSKDSCENLEGPVRSTRRPQQTNNCTQNEQAKRLHHSQQLNSHHNYASWLRDNSAVATGVREADIYELQQANSDVDRSSSNPGRASIFPGGHLPTTLSGVNIIGRSPEEPIREEHKCIAYPKPLPVGTILDACSPREAPAHHQKQQLGYSAGYLLELDDECKLSSSSSSGNKQQSATNTEYNQLR